jgi:hypothetical protein
VYRSVCVPYYISIVYTLYPYIVVILAIIIFIGVQLRVLRVTFSTFLLYSIAAEEVRWLFLPGYKFHPIRLFRALPSKIKLKKVGVGACLYGNLFVSLYWENASILLYDT